LPGCATALFLRLHLAILPETGKSPQQLSASRTGFGNTAAEW
jgi:hypothetical protein